MTSRGKLLALLLVFVITAIILAAARDWSRPSCSGGQVWDDRLRRCFYLDQQVPERVSARYN